MKIGVNIKKIQSLISTIVQEIYENIILPSVQNLDNRVTTLENNTGGEWVKLVTHNGQAEITQEFSEIRMIAGVSDTENINYSFTCNYDSNIFHNTPTGSDENFITGNPIANNYGCKFKYSVSEDVKQYISVDSCYNGGNTVVPFLEVWIKTTTNTQ